MSFKSIEVYYDVESIPNLSDRSEYSTEALEFRNDAMEHIEVALVNADAGEWEGAETGGGEVNFGFSVTDHDIAEQVIRDCVRGTEFDCIREISRREIAPDQMAEYEASAAVNAAIKPMNVYELVGALVFRKMPKRFRQS